MGRHSLWLHSHMLSAPHCRQQAVRESMWGIVTGFLFVVVLGVVSAIVVVVVVVAVVVVPPSSQPSFSCPSLSMLLP